MKDGQWPVGVAPLAPSVGHSRQGRGRVGEGIPVGGQEAGNRRTRERGGGQPDRKVTDTCNMYWKSSRPWPWRCTDSCM